MNWPRARARHKGDLDQMITNRILYRKRHPSKYEHTSPQAPCTWYSSMHQSFNHSGGYDLAQSRQKSLIGVVWAFQSSRQWRNSSIHLHSDKFPGRLGFGLRLEFKVYLNHVFESGARSIHSSNSHSSYNIPISMEGYTT